MEHLSRGVGNEWLRAQKDVSLACRNTRSTPRARRDPGRRRLWVHKGPPARHGRVERKTEQLPNIIGGRRRGGKHINRILQGRLAPDKALLADARRTRPRTVYVQQQQVVRRLGRPRRNRRPSHRDGTLPVLRRAKGTRLIERTDRAGGGVGEEGKKVRLSRLLRPKTFFWCSFRSHFVEPPRELTGHA